MKTFLLITGIVLIAACVLSVLFAVLNLAAYHNMLDGSPEHYAKMRRRATVYFIVGAYPDMAVYTLQHYMNNVYTKLNYQMVTSAAYSFAVIVLVLFGVLFFMQQRAANEING